MAPRIVFSLFLATLMVARVHMAGLKDAFSRIEAEDLDYNFGISEEECFDVDGGVNLGDINGGDVAGYYTLDIKAQKPIGISVRVSRGADADECQILVYFKSLQTTPVATINVPYTPNWNTYVTIDAQLNTEYQDFWPGDLDVFLVFSTPVSADYSMGLLNFNWFVFY